MAVSSQTETALLHQNMQKENVTIDTILDWFREAVKTRNPISANIWIESSLKLNILVEELDDAIAEIEGEMARIEGELIGEGETAAAAKRISKGKVAYTEYLKAKGKRKRIEEFIRLSKKQAQILSQRQEF